MATRPLVVPEPFQEKEVGMIDHFKSATDIRIFPVNPVPAYKANGFVNNQPAQFGLDTVAAVTLLQRGIWDQMKQNGAMLEPWTQQ